MKIILAKGVAAGIALLLIPTSTSKAGQVWPSQTPLILAGGVLLIFLLTILLGHRRNKR